jgi:FKBP-type peptidyl-prolyl cis-trans isomerase
MTKLPEGMYIQDRVVGTGPGLVAGDSAWVYYELYLHTGAPVANGLFDFELLANPPDVIDGWDIGLEGMMAGGTRLLVIPPELGYGSGARTGIPGGSILVFEVELDSIT